MEINRSCLYFISDSFFLKVNDPFLKINKANGMRPHYFTFEDEESGLLWMVPCSTQISKYKEIIERKIILGKPHNHIQIVKISGKVQALLFQDMFPILPKYIESEYRNSLGVLRIADPNKVDEIEMNAKRIITLLRHNVKFTPTQPDVLQIESIMLEEQRTLSEK
jgi:hypothetical protein